MITIVGGVYLERVMRPHWDEIYGSAGRAASSIKRMGGQVELHAYVDKNAYETIDVRAVLEGFHFFGTQVPRGVGFRYDHCLSRPTIWKPDGQYEPIEISSDNVLRYGMLEGDAVVKAKQVVYDPQNARMPQSFGINGSTADRITLVLNRHEAATILGIENASIEETAKLLVEREKADVVVIKCGPMGAVVYSDGDLTYVPAYVTSRTWKIGSGDQFAANFAYAWMEEGRPPVEAADRASRATAYYCQHASFPTPEQLDSFNPDPIQVSQKYRDGFRPIVYLAGPFFTLGQLWVVEQARNCLREMGLQVFSPYHDVGPGPAELVVTKDLDGIRECDLMLAIGDGFDSGTVFEVGYARSIERPVVMYVENESTEDLKMMAGSDCYIASDFVSAIYRTVWVAAGL